MMDYSGATVIHFRTAMAGFHKADVTNYITQTASAHRDAVKKLKEQIELLEQENAELRQNAADSDYISDLMEKAQLLDELQEENGLLKNRVHQLEYKLDAAEQQLEAAQNQQETVDPQFEAEEARLETAETPLEDVAEQPEAVEQHIEKEENLQEKELAAYRRAEAMERRVCQRMLLMEEQLGAISGQAAEQFQAATESVKTVLAGIEDYLTDLRTTSENLDAAMAEGMERLQSAADFLPKEDDAE